MLKTIQTIIKNLLTVFSRLPLRVIHQLGTLLAWVIYMCAKRTGARLRSNLRQSAIFKSQFSLNAAISQNIAESGKALLETFPIWLRSNQSVLSLVKSCTGWQHVDAALAEAKGIIFLTPHLGCFEITSLYYGARHPMAVLYRPPRQTWLLPLIQAGRQRGNITLAPANSAGVKQLLQALKRGEAIGMLPDQAPFEGEGEWAPFFGKPAYTMTLASKLAQKTGAQVLMAFGERLPRGGGYHIHIFPIADGGIGTPALMNKQIEFAVEQCPTQYLWSYDRYKVREQEAPPGYQV